MKVEKRIRSRISSFSKYRNERSFRMTAITSTESQGAKEADVVASVLHGVKDLRIVSTSS